MPIQIKGQVQELFIYFYRCKTGLYKIHYFVINKAWIPWMKKIRHILRFCIKNMYNSVQNQVKYREWQQKKTQPWPQNWSGQIKCSRHCYFLDLHLSSPRGATRWRQNRINGIYIIVETYCHLFWCHKGDGIRGDSLQLFLHESWQHHILQAHWAETDTVMWQHPHLV